LGFTGHAFTKKLKEEKVEWGVWEKLHGMWVGYMLEILGLDGNGKDHEKGTETGRRKNKGKQERREVKGVVTAQNHGAVIASADFHGAMVEVVRSRCVDRVGIKGVVVQDGKFAFVVVEKGGGVKSMLSAHVGYVDFFDGVAGQC